MLRTAVFLLAVLLVLAFPGGAGLCSCVALYLAGLVLDMVSFLSFNVIPFLFNIAGAVISWGLFSLVPGCAGVVQGVTIAVLLPLMTKVPTILVTITFMSWKFGISTIALLLHCNSSVSLSLLQLFDKLSLDRLEPKTCQAAPDAVAIPMCVASSHLGAVGERPYRHSYYFYASLGAVLLLLCCVAVFVLPLFRLLLQRALGMVSSMRGRRVSRERRGSALFQEQSLLIGQYRERIANADREELVAFVEQLCRREAKLKRGEQRLEKRKAKLKGESSVSSSPECIICLEAVVEVVFLNCGHAMWCEACARRCTQVQSHLGPLGVLLLTMHQCPICRGPSNPQKRIFVC